MKTTSFLLLTASAATLVAAQGSCDTVFGTALVSILSNTDAKACAKSFNGTDMKPVFAATLSSSELKAIAADAACQTWYQGVNTTFHNINPPCPFALGTQQFNTATYNSTLAEFLKINNAALFNATTSTTTAAPAANTTAPTTAPPTNSTTSSTAAPTVTSNAISAASTAAPAAPMTTPKASASMTASAAVAIVAAAAYMAQ
ncbi:Aste57867_16875 [Aphanomyces stellatus]|uniref:Aste57867_16875 protein n=1 Tax=Aphanomyces stellatus TaxID=120398 RepID=A0A485L6K5_9STRA|nr:hypothetical protein As57867_016817 [Aphanomyces stellatus]VFT93638.1 Aste57867_16875 [Aphanomyces stellatus]